MTDNSQKYALPTAQDGSTVQTNIKNEEELAEKISAVQNEKKSSSQQERFLELEKTIHDFLKRQDSDNTLKIITK